MIKIRTEKKRWEHLEKALKEVKREQMDRNFVFHTGPSGVEEFNKAIDNMIEIEKLKLS